MQSRLSAIVNENRAEIHKIKGWYASTVVCTAIAFFATLRLR